MRNARATWRWIALIGLWTLTAAICWLMAIQLFMVLLHSFGTWQRPGIARVTILSIYPDDQTTFTDFLQVKQGEEERTICMLKQECAQLKVDDEIWILDNYFATPLRPAQFRLTPWRLLVEYPEPLLILAVFGIWRIRRAQAKALKLVMDQPRKTLQDDFHLRAGRFTAPKEDPSREEMENKKSEP